VRDDEERDAGRAEGTRATSIKGERAKKQRPYAAARTGCVPGEASRLLPSGQQRRSLSAGCGRETFARGEKYRVIAIDSWRVEFSPRPNF